MVYRYIFLSQMLSITYTHDVWQNYDIHYEIGRGSTCVVYLATCKRGRMRNRRVALKKVNTLLLLENTTNHYSGMCLDGRTERFRWFNTTRLVEFAASFALSPMDSIHTLYVLDFFSAVSCHGILPKWYPSRITSVAPPSRTIGS